MDLKNITMDDLKQKLNTIDKKTLIKIGSGFITNTSCDGAMLYEGESSILNFSLMTFLSERTKRPHIIKQ